MVSCEFIRLPGLTRPWHVWGFSETPTLGPQQSAWLLHPPDSWQTYRSASYHGRPNATKKNDGQCICQSCDGFPKKSPVWSLWCSLVPSKFKPKPVQTHRWKNTNLHAVRCKLHIGSLLDQIRPFMPLLGPWPCHQVGPWPSSPC